MGMLALILSFSVLCCRQGLVTDQVSLHVLVERHLPLEYRQLLIPCAPVPSVPPTWLNILFTVTRPTTPCAES